MDFSFNRLKNQNYHESLAREWILTNGLGSYASSSVLFCHTRKYHGLFVANLTTPPGRHVLLSTLDESILSGQNEYSISCRKHPDVYYPKGHELLDNVKLGACAEFNYTIEHCAFTRKMIMVQGVNVLLLRYSFTSTHASPPPFALRIKPLLTFRNFHALTFANPVANTQVKNLDSVGCEVAFKMYEGFPSLHMHVTPEALFVAKPDWCRTIQYSTEKERGFSAEEDTFIPGHFDISLHKEQEVILAVSLEPFASLYPHMSMAELWDAEVALHKKQAPKVKNLIGHLSQEGQKFIIKQPDGEPALLAGYHWFDAWGRDTFIALPGLTFAANHVQKGKEILFAATKNAKNGLIPNMYSPDGNHAYNSIDASLWYVWAVQQMLHYDPKSKQELKKHCWPLIKDIIQAYSSGAVPHVNMDTEGFLHIGSLDTQLTWMDANAYGKPVTPRHGCPVEMTALWFNTLSFANQLAIEFKEPDATYAKLATALQKSFVARFWIPLAQGGYLADVWRLDKTDTSLRPNSLFAISLPYPILADATKQGEVVEQITRHLLTPFGLRTLAPYDPNYCPLYKGNPDERDATYHQGTVWPWPVGAYTESLLCTTPDAPKAVQQLLTTLTPLFTRHLGEAGVGSISEIFDADFPHNPHGCIAQAWSVAEVLRSLTLCKKATPEVYAEWEKHLQAGGI